MNEYKIIVPTIGRKVWLFIDQASSRRIGTEGIVVLDKHQWLDATIVYVHPAKEGAGYDYVTVAVLDHAGNRSTLIVPLRQAGQDAPDAREWVEWMPYQVGQAAKRAPAQAVVECDDPKPGSKQQLSFSTALELLELGTKVARLGWNGKGLRLELQRPDAHSKMTLPYIFLAYPEDAQNTPGARVPWMASQTDLLAKDWVAA